MTKTIKFSDKRYVERVYPGITPDIISVELLAGPEAVALHNTIATALNQPRVKRFADLKTAAKRTWAILVAFDKAGEDDLPASGDLKPVHDSASDKPNQMKIAGLAAAKAKLDAKDKAQIADEAASRKAPPQSEALMAVAAAAGAKAQAQAALRASPPASDNPAKDAEMPTLRKAVKVMDLSPKKKVYARKAGSKQAILVDLLSRSEGATFGELYDALAANGKPWRGVTIRSGLAWDMNHVTGYGVSSELFNGEEFAKQGRDYEAARLGIVVLKRGNFNVPSAGYDPELKLAVYHLTYPAGMDAPLPHTPKKV